VRTYRTLRTWVPIALLLSPACMARSAVVHVGVVFADNWAFGPTVLSEPEVVVLKENALATLRQAYAGYNVSFTEGADAERVIRIDRGGFMAGATPIGSRVSRVSLDGTYLSLLVVAGCPGLETCATKTRAELVAALGRGAGATAAHELGHQAGLRFCRDSPCAECYDGSKSSTREHFFGTKHWSPQATAMMKHVLPSSPGSQGSRGSPGARSSENPEP